MFQYLHTVMNPDAFHGHKKRGPFFEGWYFKLIDANEQHRWCIIPGVYIGQDPADSHAFIQIMNGITGQSIYHTYPFQDFSSLVGRFDVKIADNHFSANALKINVSTPELSVQGELTFEGVTPWPVTPISPGIMGWYGWLDFMECYHGVVSLNHNIHGKLTINNEPVEFTDGTGYIEKDWGQSFPKAWIWMQTNHFSQPRTCMTASAAIIPWRKSTFNGYIAGLWQGNQLHRFATYTGAKLDHISTTDHEVHLTLSDRSKRLELTATRAEGGILQAPTLTQMDRRIMETLSATVQVTLCERKGTQWLKTFSDIGRYAGLEAIGSLENR
ncbi:MAG: hypothetical protein HGA86_04360 [Anaerolineaceae bacterium]|nr:hypothetical protein [Anaerolineaceae bacterium]